MVKTSNCPPLVAMSVVTRCRRTFSSRVTYFRVTAGFLAVKSPVRRCILIMSALLTVATVRVVWAIAWLARIREIPPIAARSGILIVSLPVEWLNALRPGHMLGAASAIVNSDSRPVQTRVDVAGSGRDPIAVMAALRRAAPSTCPATHQGAREGRRPAAMADRVLCGRAHLPEARPERRGGEDRILSRAAAATR